MPRMTIYGGEVLNGEVTASGSKNAVLPIIAAAIMMDGETTITNVPNLADVWIMVRMLKSLGLRTEFTNHTIKIWNTKKVRHIAPYELVTSMRASFFVAGPILAKTGFAKVPLPGGCSIGARPVDLHLKGFEGLGAEVGIEHGFVTLRAKSLKGARIYLDFPSVGATENIVMAACLAEGQSVIENCAQEPEVIDLCHFLIRGGAKIEGIGTSKITVDGVRSLTGVCDYPVIYDRVEVGTLLIAGAITGGDVKVNQVDPNHLGPVLQKLRECGVKIVVEGNAVRAISQGRPTAVDIETVPFPGFPTDMQAQMMSLLTISEGNCIVKEMIFENRFMHARELMRMGANIKLDHQSAFISGVEKLSGAEVKITDLRAGAALILAGLVAEGETTVYGMSHLMRGYEDLPAKLKKLGANLQSGGSHDL